MRAVPDLTGASLVILLDLHALKADSLKKHKKKNVQKIGIHSFCILILQILQGQESS